MAAGNAGDGEAVEVGVLDDQVHARDRLAAFFAGFSEFSGLARGVDTEDFCQGQHGGDDAEDAGRVADGVSKGGQGLAVGNFGFGVALGDDGDGLLRRAEGGGVGGCPGEKPHAAERVHSAEGDQEDRGPCAQRHHGGGERIEPGAVVFQRGKKSGAELHSDRENEKHEPEFAHELEDAGVDADAEMPGDDPREENGRDAGADAADLQAGCGQAGGANGGEHQHGPGDRLGLFHFNEPVRHGLAFHRRTLVASSGNRPHAESGVEGAGEFHFTGGHMQPTLLIVDDEKNTRDGLRNALEGEFEVYVAADIDGAMAVLESVTADVLLTDLRLGGEDGMALIEKVRKRPNPPICIMMTAYGSVDTAVEAMRHGAYDFVTKPVNIDRLEILIKRAVRERETSRENRELRSKVQSQSTLEGMIGRSPAMVQVFETIKQVAPSRATVLVQGESGTGKELAAHAIHHLSPRAKGKFVAVHCAALTPELLASELFGHEKGAFTGAFERRIGRFEQAKGGTLFLDEIGEIDSATQVKILRVLGERTFERVGGGETLNADVRLIAATNKDLSKLVAEGKFRDDLFFRLHVVPLTMPPLRDRKVDIPLLVEAFLKDAALENEKPRRDLASEAMQRVLEYDWPGNVRELRTAIEHGVVMASGPQIGLRDLPATLRAEASRNAPASTAAHANGLNLRDSETALILKSLEECRGNRSAAAQKLGISRRTLHRRLQELNISKRQKRT